MQQLRTLPSREFEFWIVADEICRAVACDHISFALGEVLYVVHGGATVGTLVYGGNPQPLIDRINHMCPNGGNHKPV